AIGIALAAAVKPLSAAVASRGDRAGHQSFAAAAAPAATLMMVALLLVGSFPAMLAASIGYRRITHWPDWRAAGEILASRPDLRGVTLGATRSLPAYFYWGRVEFSVAVGHLERWDADLDSALRRVESGHGAYAMAVTGSADPYAGVPVLP